MHPEDFLILEEWNQLLKAAQSTREAAILCLLRGAGMRVSEVAAQKAEHVDGAGGCNHVVNGKGGTPSTSILPTPALEAIQAHLIGRDKEGYVFEGRIVAISTRQIQRLLNTVAQKRGLQEIRPGKVRQVEENCTAPLEAQIWEIVVGCRDRCILPTTAN